MTGNLGVFSPSIGLSRKDLQDAGFDDARIACFLSHTYPSMKFRAVLQIHPMRSSDPLLYGSEARISSNSALQSAENGISKICSSRKKQGMRSSPSTLDRSLYEAEPGMFYPFFSYKGTKAYRSLDERERSVFDGLIAKINSASEAMWEKRGKAI
jgi:hypothetical protein